MGARYDVNLDIGRKWLNSEYLGENAYINKSKVWATSRV